MPPSHGLCRLPSRASLPSVESRFIVRAARGEDATQYGEVTCLPPWRGRGWLYLRPGVCLGMARSGQERAHDREE